MEVSILGLFFVEGVIEGLLTPAAIKAETLT
jgi:hypothetical protein